MRLRFGGPACTLTTGVTAGVLPRLRAVSRLSVWIKVVTAALALAVAGCGSTSQVASFRSPSPAATVSAGASPSASPTASPQAGDPRLVIADYGKSEVRLARLDAHDTGVVKGQFQQITGGVVLVVNGTSLIALDHSGKSRTLGQLSGAPESVVAKADLSQWMYLVLGPGQLYELHIGSPSGDRLVGTNPAPTQEQLFRPFAWNATGIYVTKEPLGLGGAGPFLEYHFPLAKLDPATGQVTEISPACVAYAVLDDGTLVCGNRGAGTIEVRRASGGSHAIAMGTDVNGFIRVAVSPDSLRLIAARNGSKNPVINYQMLVAQLTSTGVTVFGATDFLPDAWLPDGRLIATHQCVIADWGGGPCNGAIDGTYVFSSDGSSHSLFFKLAQGARVVGSI